MLGFYAISARAIASYVTSAVAIAKSSVVGVYPWMNRRKVFKEKPYVKDLHKIEEKEKEDFRIAIRKMIYESTSSNKKQVIEKPKASISTVFSRKASFNQIAEPEDIGLELLLLFAA